jgi:uncharacterized protein (DUF2336 family)
MAGDDLMELARQPSREKRSALLRRITDLFFDGVSERNISENELFEEVVLRLMKDVDIKGRAELAGGICANPNVPRRVIVTLAADDIAVARPVLEHSPVLLSRDLVKLSGLASDAHLQAMSRRKTLSETVTDVLIERGSRLVWQLLAANAGARFTMQSFGKLLREAKHDETLQFELATRPDLPVAVVDDLSRLLSDKLRHTLRAMGINAPETLAPALLETLHLRLSAALDERDREVREISTIIRDIACGASSLEREILPLTRADRAYDVASIVSELAGVDHATVMKALIGQNEEPLVVLFRSLDVKWETFEAVLQLRAKRQRRIYVKSLSLARIYQGMDRATAQRVLRFLQIRRNSETRAA